MVPCSELFYMHLSLFSLQGVAIPNNSAPGPESHTTDGQDALSFTWDFPLFQNDKGMNSYFKYAGMNLDHKRS